MVRVPDSRVGLATSEKRVQPQINKHGHTELKGLTLMHRTCYTAPFITDGRRSTTAFIEKLRYSN